MTILDYQINIGQWFKKCFGSEENDKCQRHYRFFEESIELVQSLGMTKEECLQLIEYVYSRPIGEVKNEIGGVCTTLTALCFIHNIDLEDCAIEGLNLVWKKIDKIRDKWQNRSGVLPG